MGGPPPLVKLQDEHADAFHFPFPGGVSLELLIGLFGTALGLGMTAVGLMVQKYALNAREDSKENRSYCFDKTWMCGMMVFCVGNLVFWIFTALVPQVVLACWQCWAMIVTVFFAPPLLGETVSLWKLLSVGVIVFGLVWVVLACPGTEEPFTSEMFWAAATKIVFLSILAVSALVFIFLLSTLYFWRLGPRVSSVRYILIAVLINWYSVLSARCSSEFMITTVYYQDNQAGKWDFYALILCMLLLAVSNVHFLNRALEIGDAVFVVPVYEAFAIGGQIMFGIVFFDEFRGLSGWEKLNIWVAVSVVLGGVIATSANDPPVKCLRQIVLSEDYGDRYCPCLSCCCCCCRKRDRRDRREVHHARDDEAVPILDRPPSRYSGPVGETGGTFPTAPGGTPRRDVRQPPPYLRPSDADRRF